MKRMIIALLCLTIACACASQKPEHAEYINQKSDIAEPNSLQLTYAGPTTLAYFGLPNYDHLNVDGGAGVLYPGGHAAVFLASVLTHAVIVDSAKEARRSRIQNQADQVLAPYQEHIDSLSYREMMSGAVTKLSDVGQRFIVSNYYDSTTHLEGNAWILESNPSFYMLQDEGAILVQNTVVIYSDEEQPKIIYQNIVEVISQPYQGDSPHTFWTANNGAKLKNLSVELLADSVRLAMDDMRHQFSFTTEHDQTFHFYQEGKKAYERGRLLAVEADRLTIRTLRGWLKSVPIISDQNPYFIPLEDSVANLAAVRGIGIYY
ncbi:MAG: hypothetical protein AAF542_14205 [Pseudomonadota bacterium]